MRGSFPSPELNWFDWLGLELKTLGHEVILEDFPSDKWEDVNSLGEKNIDRFKPLQSLTTWENFFRKNILHKIQNESFIFVGHSIAPVFFLHMLEKYNLTVTLAVFVSPFFNLDYKKDQWQFYPVNKTFYKSDFDFSKINKRIEQSFVVYGEDDPYIPQEQILEFANKTNSAQIAVEDGQHLGDSFKELPIVLQLIKENIHA